jgi:micrococcal nuclease
MAESPHPLPPTARALAVALALGPFGGACAQEPPPSGASAACAVERVIDGDTFVCVGGERVRLLLIDTPELAQGPYGRTAREEAVRLLPVGAHVRLDLDVQPRDRYGRLLAYVWVDREAGEPPLMVNRALVRRGMAVVSVYPPNVRHVDLMRAAADSARAERAGLWEGSAFDCAPADYRADRCR